MSRLLRPACWSLAALLLAATTGCSSVWPGAGGWALSRPAPATEAAQDFAAIQAAPPHVAAASAAAAAPADAGESSFRLGPEDALEVSVWKDDALKATVLVRPDGVISFPLVGEIVAAGRTVAEVREEIARRLARFVPDAEVSVSLVRALSFRIYVLGRVNRPGDFVVGRPLDVLQALSLAGGTTPFARESDILIVRRVKGQPQSLPFDLERLRRHGDLSQNVLLRSGDVLIVP